MRNTVRAAATVTGAKLKRMANWNRAHRVNRPAKVQRPNRLNKLVVLGTSTGGPKALANLIPALPGDLPACILLVQHMPPMFTKSLADRLNQSSEIRVKEAEEGDKIEPGTILLAPGGYHMTLNKNGTIALNQDQQIVFAAPCRGGSQCVGGRRFDQERR